MLLERERLFLLFWWDCGREDWELYIRFVVVVWPLDERAIRVNDKYVIYGRKIF